MKMRRITAVERGAKSTTLRLECGHDRSIGGHVFPNGAPAPADMGENPMAYPCHDGHCGGRP